VFKISYCRLGLVLREGARLVLLGALLGALLSRLLAETGELSLLVEPRAEVGDLLGEGGLLLAVVLVGLDGVCDCAARFV